MWCRGLSQKPLAATPFAPSPFPSPPRGEGNLVPRIVSFPGGEGGIEAKPGHLEPGVLLLTPVISRDLPPPGGGRAGEGVVITKKIPFWDSPWLKAIYRLFRFRENNFFPAVVVGHAPPGCSKPLRSGLCYNILSAVTLRRSPCVTGCWP